MKKILLFIVPVITLMIAYRFNQELQSYNSAVLQSEKQLEKNRNLDLLTQNYLISRIETLHLLSTQTSTEMKEQSMRKRGNADKVMSFAEAFLKDKVESNEEKLLLDEMLAGLGQMKDLMQKSSLANARESIESMVQNRGSYRQSAQTYATYLGSLKMKADQMKQASMENMKTLLLVFVILQMAGILTAVFYVRTIRSQI